MKNTNLLSLINLYDCMDSTSFDKYLQHLEVSFKSHEIKCLSEMVKQLTLKSYVNTSNFYIGYKIPQIAKEFDLLRIGEEYTLNIELKTTFKEEAVLTQLLQNKRYLNFLNTDLELFCYASDTRLFYHLNENEELEVVPVSEIRRVLNQQNIIHIANMDDLFHINNFLVSPFNNVDRFIEDKYYLTNIQLDTKIDILKNLKKHNFSIIDAKPGTGKSLLLYDLAKELRKEKQVIIIHSGMLNQGHRELIDDYEWNIYSMKDFKQGLSMIPEIILIDETQRALPWQLSEIITYVENNDETHCVFSIDQRQVLAPFENEWNNLNCITSLDKTKSYTLGNSIRTNKELAGFIKGLFNLKYLNYHHNYDKIDLHYFNSMDEARVFANILKKDNYTIIDHTPQRINSLMTSQTVLGIGTNAHKIIGQEFDNVCCIIGPGFHYDSNRNLKYIDGTYYDPSRMLFQAVTRSKDRLAILFVDVPDVFSSILNTINVKA